MASSETKTSLMPLWMLSVRKSADCATDGSANVETRRRSIAVSSDVQKTTSAPSAIGCDAIRAERLNAGQSAGRTAASSDPAAAIDADDRATGTPTFAVDDSSEAPGVRAGASLHETRKARSGVRNTARFMGPA